MSKNSQETPYLCGGTFFLLLLLARKERKQFRANQSNFADELSDKHLMAGLIQVFNDTNIFYTKDMGFDTKILYSIKTHTSRYKNCDISYGGCLDFNNPSKLDEFNKILTNNYDVIKSRFSEFIELFIDENKINRLAKQLIQLIFDAINIDDNSLFFINDGTNPITRKQIRKMNTIVIENLLTGIFHYILNKCQDNTKGKATYLMWTDEPNGENQPRQIDSSKINIDKKDYKIKIEKAKKIEHITPENIEYDTFEEKSAISNDKNTTITQNAEKIYNFNGYIDTLNFY